LVEVDADLATAVVPYVTAAVAAYGTSVMERIRDGAADATAEATVGAGRRLLRRILQRDVSRAGVTDVVTDLAHDPTDEDRVAALRLLLRKVLAVDSGLATDVRAILQEAPAMTAAEARSVAVQQNSGIIQTGDGSTAWQGHG
jgi:hypothetical protein